MTPTYRALILYNRSDDIKPSSSQRRQRYTLCPSQNQTGKLPRSSVLTYMSLGVLSQEMPASKRGSLLRRTEGASNHRQRTVMMTYCPRHQGLRSPDAGCDFIIKNIKKTNNGPFYFRHAICVFVGGHETLPVRHSKFGGALSSLPSGPGHKSENKFKAEIIRRGKCLQKQQFPPKDDNSEKNAQPEIQ